MPCFIGCGEDAGSRKLKLYVSVEDGYYHCLAGDTGVITRGGTRRIADVADQEAELLTSGGQWVHAKIRDFGRQRLWAIKLTRNRREKILYATDQHRWIVDGYEVLTRDLRVGAKLDAVIAEQHRVASSRCIARGVYFGDGSGHHVALWGEKQELLRHFESYGTVVDLEPTAGGVQGIRVNGLDPAWKQLPDLETWSDSDLLGWLMGYFATDGTVNRTSFAIDSTDPAALQCVRDIANRLGIVTGPISTYLMKASKIAPAHEVMRVQLHGTTLWPDFFLRNAHRARFNEQVGGHATKVRWRVTDVCPTSRTETVYCAIVPGTETFALEDNILTGNCKVCDSRGGTYLLQEHFGDDPRPGKVEYDGSRRKILEEATELGMQMLANNDDLLTYLMDERGLSPETVIERKLGWVGNGWSLANGIPGQYTDEQLRTAGLMQEKDGRTKEFFFRHLLIPYTHRSSVSQIRGRIWPEDGFKGGKYWTSPSMGADLFGRDELSGAEDAIITEGEFDAMVLRQHLATCPDLRLRNAAVVAIPGTGTFAEEWIPFFEDVKRIYIALDPDDAGKRAAQGIKDKLGSRARIVTLPEELPKCDWSAYLLPIPADANDGWRREHPHAGHTWQDVQRLLLSSSGRRLYTVAESLASYRAYKAENPHGIKLGYKQIDAVLEPGMLPGQLLVLAAKTGCIQGDAEIAVNRAGKGFTIKLADLVHRFNGGAPGGGRKWNRSIPTYVQREVEGKIRLGRLVDAWRSGVKQTYTVTTETGRTIRATDEHPFLTERGWLRLDELKVDDEVHVRGHRGAAGRQKKGKHYFYRSGLIHHPYRNRRNVRAGGNSVPLHRLVYEAHHNGVTLSDFLTVLRLCPEEAASFKFFDPDVWAVHHIDHDEKNNEISNLALLTHEQHAALHAEEGTTGNVQLRVVTERVISIEPFGLEETYDLEVADEPHNFLANGFVVHNTGKTLVLCNLAMHLLHRRVLFITLEMTKEEIILRLERIYLFWYPEAKDEDIAAAFDRLMICEENRLGERDFKALVEEYTIEKGAVPEIAFIDYLGYYARGQKGGSPYEKTTNAVMQLKAEAKSHRLVVIAPTQVNRGVEAGRPVDLDSMRDSGAVEETADFVIAVFRPDDAQQVDGVAQPTGKVRMQVLKSRHGGVGTVASLQMDLLTLALVDDNTTHAKKAQQHNFLQFRGHSWDDLRRQETAPKQLRMGGPK
jgi:replicative DNA helicase